jgi:hypothetical protein
MMKIATIILPGIKMLLTGVLLMLSLTACHSFLSFLPSADYATTEGGESMSTKVNVELDIFSGNPNPDWTLPSEAGVLFLQKLKTLPSIPAKDISNHLGYRGFSVQVVNGTEQSQVYIQNGMVQIITGTKKVYYSDQDRNLERWLLESGKPFLQNDLFRIVENDLLK